MQGRWIAMRSAARVPNGLRAHPESPPATRPGCSWRSSMYHVRAGLSAEPRRSCQSLATAVLFFTAVACTDGHSPTAPDPVDPNPAAPTGVTPQTEARALVIARSGGDDQMGIVGSELPNRIAVRITDA